MHDICTGVQLTTSLSTYLLLLYLCLQFYRNWIRFHCYFICFFVCCNCYKCKNVSFFVYERNNFSFYLNCLKYLLEASASMLPAIIRYNVLICFLSEGQFRCVASMFIFLLLFGATFRQSFGRRWIQSFLLLVVSIDFSTMRLNEGKTWPFILQLIVCKPFSIKEKDRR